MGKLKHAPPTWFLIILAATASAQWRHFGEGASFSRNMLARHNAVRARVGMPALAWSARLAARAQDWADSLLARGRGREVWVCNYDPPGNWAGRRPY
ncbi:MAG: CAP domain-containing protein [Bryobacteraceae bacterium]